MQADEGVEDEQARAQMLDGVGEAVAIFGKVEAEDGGGDDLDVEGIEAFAGGERDAFKATSDDVQGVLGGEEQDTASGDRREASEARHAGGNSHRHVEGKEGLAALGLAADDTDSLGSPQSFDEPAALFGHDGERVRWTEGQKLAHRRTRGGRVLAGGRGLGPHSLGRGEDFEEELLVELLGLTLDPGGKEV